ncbi:THAP domain-containing protein 2-like [Bombyx mandarina]|uniref:THAP domain-containing protein 2-like n=1 Tax=Bombyx mandarina TaxID=7092 RepID=A0A6J2K540_BOMMA|nr:THAP domain-containing protein 2-like [Bombyx mandarina]
MVNTCIVSGCKRESYPGCGISFHRIPANEKQRALWITSMNLDNNMSKFACVCSLHFNQDDYLTETKKKLKPEAVPSVFPKIFQGSKKTTVLSIQNMELESSIQPSTSSDITQAGTSCERGGSSSKYDVGISGELSSRKVKQEETSTQMQELKNTPRKAKLRRDVKVLKQKLKRREIKIGNLRSILNLLKKNAKF